MLSLEQDEDEGTDEEEELEEARWKAAVERARCLHEELLLQLRCLLPQPLLGAGSKMDVVVVGKAENVWTWDEAASKEKGEGRKAKAVKDKDFSGGVSGSVDHGSSVRTRYQRAAAAISAPSTAAPVTRGASSFFF